MPELPEVETVKEKLKKKILNRQIINVTTHWDNIIEYPDVLTFKKEIINQTITDITRKGKWLIFHLDDYYLLSHLRMEGKYFYKEKKEPFIKHEHIIFHLDNDYDLRYHDTRKFGKMHLVKKADFNEYYIVKELGLEPWDPHLDIKYLKQKMQSNLPVKSLLLDQTIITGIGNIYADEILFKSRLNPNKKGKLLNNKDLNNIIKYTKETLAEAIKKGGTTIRSYTSEENVAGLFQNDLLVHSKEHQPCPSCHQPIKKIKVGTRGTYYCPNCQND